MNSINSMYNKLHSFAGQFVIPASLHGSNTRNEGWAPGVFQEGLGRLIPDEIKRMELGIQTWTSLLSKDPELGPLEISLEEKMNRGIERVNADHKAYGMEPCSIENRFSAAFQGKLAYLKSLKEGEVDVDGVKIKYWTREVENAKEGRWVLASLGNSQLADHTVLSPSNTVRAVADTLESNFIVFDYAGVGRSGGSPNREITEKAYKKILGMLEEEKKAKEIIGYGISIGGATQADGFKGHEKKDGVKYLCIKDRTFSSVSSVIWHSRVSVMGNIIEKGRSLVPVIGAVVAYPIALIAEVFVRALAIPVKLLLILGVKASGWDMNTEESSKSLKDPEVIMQTAQPKGGGIVDMIFSNNFKASESEAGIMIPNDIDREVVDDEVIASKAALAPVLMRDKTLEGKIYIGIPESHNQGLSKKTLDVLRKTVNRALA